MYVDSNPAADGGMRARVRVLRGGDAMMGMALGAAIGACLIACPPVGIPAFLVWGIYWMWRLR